LCFFSFFWNAPLFLESLYFRLLYKSPHYRKAYCPRFSSSSVTFWACSSARKHRHHVYRKSSGNTIYNVVKVAGSEPLAISLMSTSASNWIASSSPFLISSGRSPH
jgi:hypothetical protein